MNFKEKLKKISQSQYLMFDKRINVLSKMIVFIELITKLWKEIYKFFTQKNNMKWLKIRSIHIFEIIFDSFFQNKIDIYMYIYIYTDN